MENISGVWVPRTWKGMTLMEDPEIGTITHKLRFGDSNLGWDGNAGLGIYLGPYIDDQTGVEIGTCWQIWMFGQGEPYLVMRSRPGTHLDERVIIEIMKHDTRYHNVAAEMKAHNERLTRELQIKHAAREQEVREEIYRQMTKRSRRSYYTGR